MESSFIYITILLLSVFEFSSGIVYNRDAKEYHFTCYNEGTTTNIRIIKLFLSHDNLKIHCFFQGDSEDYSRAVLGVFTTGGTSPSILVMNSTYISVFHFHLSLFNNRLLWTIDIPRENITVNTDIAAVEEWVIRLTMHEKVNIYSTEGTLLDLVREPILQWSLGPTLNKTKLMLLLPYVIDIKVAKCPCANDVALVAFVFNSTHSGVYVGKTIYGFWRDSETEWYDLTQAVYAELKDDHKGLTVIDMVITNHFLVILTSLGLFVSPDLRYPTTSHIQLSRAPFCGFERVDYIKGKLWYNEKCFANRESFEVDYVTITFDRNRTLSESSSCFYSKEPFREWLPCLSASYRSTRFLPHVVSFLIDQETSAGIYLFHHQGSKRTSVSVSMLKNGKPNPQTKFPAFKFPSSFNRPIGMVFHPRSHFLYVYGNEVWISPDGGNSFDLLSNFHTNVILRTAHSFYTSHISFISQFGNVYNTKAGLRRYTRVGKIPDKIFMLYYDQMGYIHKLTPDRFNTDTSHPDYGTLKLFFGALPDLGFNTPLAPQFLSRTQMIFFAFIPLNEPRKFMHQKMFKNIHSGKRISHSKSGLADIIAVYHHTSGPLGFYSSLVAELINPFAMEDKSESPSLSSALSISSIGNSSYVLSLESKDPNYIFKSTDVEKTVVIPGQSSFFITHIKDQWTALSFATMPQIVKSNVTLSENSWFLYNFGSTDGRNWTIHVKPCNYWIQADDDDFMSLNHIRYIDVGNSADLAFKFIPNIEGERQPLQVPPMSLIVGNPSVFEIKSQGRFDSTDNYRMKVDIINTFFLKGSTTVSVVVWDASAECFVTTLVPTIKSSCSYLRTLHHIPGRYIPPAAWISGVQKDSQGFNMIKTLPVNYRPPSNMGISIPLTDNFYHADPSKPIPRNLFYKSKETGKYKQCANATSREMCNCTEHQKFSHAVAFSDCKEKVHRFRFPVTQYPVVLEIFNEQNQKFPVKPPYLVTVTEVNKRKNWELKHAEPESVKKMKNYLEPLLKTPVYNPFGLNLSIKGSELFHFKVSMVPGLSFCNLEEEFQIYVDEVPLPFPGHALIAIATSVVLGGLIFVSFLFQMHNIHPLRAFRRHRRRHTTNPSDTSINS